MNLVIDVGNTLVKLGVFDSDSLKHKKSCIKPDFLPTLEEIYESFPAIKRSIVSSVSNLSEHQLSKLKQLYKVLILNHETEVPFKNSYTTPQTLGIDRIALVSAAAHKHKEKNVLIIDAGTCITYDFLNDKNEYLGGAISPGITMRYKSLHTFTAKLPLLEATSTKLITGNSTVSAIHSGVVNGMLFEIDGFITAYKENYENLTVILTGGDAHFLRDSIKNDIFANSNFLMEGLNHILEYNNH
ncbi:type III pantothenate kinase [Aequorivita marisscotiae]|uniref:Type III pantothenate kinase n=1 Tax=Aequorivita marisscotiae TaxID=3040348 RepID=A0ABY8KYW3_9FLAO|nr:type III pantothenate kinase [Aequorivita sp. Ant34-E75]WGF93021.1 type III pantothenate kinase [Aequorivita sp. Ant34-E75]